jgi:uncharacterized membrane protein YdbT with pleckstrin-like domain
MNLERSLFAVFKPIKHPDETIYWAGRPHFFFFIVPAVMALLGGVIWLQLPYRLLYHAAHSRSVGSLIVGLIFLAVPASCVLHMVNQLLRYRRTVYAITDRRVLIREGTFSLEFASIDFGRITEIRVSQNIFQSALGLGTLLIYVGGTLKDRTNHESFVSIHDPHQVCKKLTEISVSPIAVV